MNRLRFPLVSMYLLCLSFSLAAQEFSKPDKKPGLELGFDYTNTNVYMGRADRKDAAVLAPDLGYTFSNGIFLTGSADFIPSHKSKVLDNGSLELGYIYNLTDYLEGSISFTKMFYAAHSTRISSSVSSEFNANLDFNNDILSPGLDIGYAIGKTGTGNDIFLSPDLSHKLVFEKVFGHNDRLTLSPTVQLNAGTQHFYSNDFAVKRTTVKRNAKAFRPQVVNISELNKLSLLDYELSLPITYSLKPFLFSFNPVLALPQNTLPSQITRYEQNKAYLFYMNLGLILKF